MLIVSFAAGSDPDSCRRTFRILQFDCNNDGGTVHRRRRYLPDRSCQDDKQQDDDACRQEPAASVPACDDRNRYNRFCGQQHRYCGCNDAYCSQYGCSCRNLCTPSAYAARLCKQHGRYDDTYRYSSQPYCKRHPPECRL